MILIHHKYPTEQNINFGWHLLCTEIAEFDEELKNEALDIVQDFDNQKQNNIETAYGLLGHRVCKQLLFSVYDLSEHFVMRQNNLYIIMSIKEVKYSKKARW